MKKKYLKPTMQVVDIIVKPQILAGSGDVQIQDVNSEMDDLFFGGSDIPGLLDPA